MLRRDSGVVAVVSAPTSIVSSSPALHRTLHAPLRHPLRITRTRMVHPSFEMT